MIRHKVVAKDYNAGLRAGLNQALTLALQVAQRANVDGHSGPVLPTDLAREDAALTIANELREVVKHVSKPEHVVLVRCKHVSDWQIWGAPSCREQHWLDSDIETAMFIRIS